MNKINKRIVIFEEDKGDVTKVFDSGEIIPAEVYDSLLKSFIAGQENIFYAYGEYNEDFCPEDFIDFWKVYQIGFIDGHKLADTMAKRSAKKGENIENFEFEE